MREPDYISELNWGFTNFDHIGYAFLSIFQSITLEGWVDIMYMVQDAGYVEIAGVYFVLLVLIGAFFMINLTLAVIWDNFAQANEEEEDSIVALHKKPSMRTIRANSVKPKKTPHCLGALVNHWLFSAMITFFIILNTVTLSLDKHPSDPELEYNVEVINFVLTIIFTIETIIKIAGMGVKEWSDDQMNLFDAFIVAISAVELIFTPPEFLAQSSGDSDQQGGALSVLRTFRLFRIFKLARYFLFVTLF